MKYSFDFVASDFYKNEPKKNTARKVNSYLLFLPITRTEQKKGYLGRFIDPCMKFVEIENLPLYLKKGWFKKGKKRKGF